MFCTLEPFPKCIYYLRFYFKVFCKMLLLLFTFWVDFITSLFYLIKFQSDQEMNEKESILRKNTRLILRNRENLLRLQVFITKRIVNM